jgi:hypothetical protein
MLGFFLQVYVAFRLIVVIRAQEDMRFYNLYIFLIQEYSTKLPCYILYGYISAIWHFAI